MTQCDETPPKDNGCEQVPDDKGTLPAASTTTTTTKRKQQQQQPTNKKKSKATPPTPPTATVLTAQRFLWGLHAILNREFTANAYAIIIFIVIIHSAAAHTNRHLPPLPKITTTSHHPRLSPRVCNLQGWSVNCRVRGDGAEFIGCTGLLRH